MAAISNKAVSTAGQHKSVRRSPPSRRRASRSVPKGRRTLAHHASAPSGLEALGSNVELLHESVPPRHQSSSYDAVDTAISPESRSEGLQGETKVRKEPTSFLAMYFREMAALEVLRPEEEFAVAQRIEALEIDVWTRLFGYAPIVGRILNVIERCMDDSLPEFRPLRRAATETCKSDTTKNHEKLTRSALKCAEVLRAADSDKLYLEAVLADLRDIERGVAPQVSSKPAFTPDAEFLPYLEQVRMAEQAASMARNEFVKANLRLVVSIARRFNHGRMALADLIQEGNIGLMKAVERYDYRRGFRFSTYASWWIRHAISRALADKGREIRLPVHMIDAQHRLSKAKRELTSKLGRQPTNEELGEATQMTLDKVEKMRTYILDQSVSLDKPINDEDGRSFVEFLQDTSIEPPAESLALDTLTQELRHMLRELKPIEAAILRQRFGLDDDQEMTLKQIGEKYNLSRERIRQLQEQALTKIRRALQRKSMM